MRLIDADALRKPIYAEDDNITGIGMTYDEMDAYNCGIKETWKIVEEAPTVEPVPRWHRVEEKPKKHGKYLVCYVEKGEFYWEEAHYCFYQDGDKWTAWSSYQDDDVEITPDYWMPIEPPKEDA